MSYNLRYSALYLRHTIWQTGVAINQNQELLSFISSCSLRVESGMKLYILKSFYNTNIIKLTLKSVKSVF